MRKMQNAKSVCTGILIVLLLPIIHLGAQQAPTRSQPAPAQPLPAVSQSAPLAAPSTFLLGPDDQIIIQGPEMDELVNRPYRIDPDGYVSLPMLGRIKAMGMTIGEFETQLNQVASKYVRDPQLVASVAEFHSQPISVV